jgi:hypothetical protein
MLEERLPPAPDTGFRPIHISGYTRLANDFYPTPAWVTEALVKTAPLRGPIWEACCGDGAMAKVLERNGHKVVATDLYDRGYGEAGVDFFQQQAFPAGCRCMVTNPPYGDGSLTRQGRNSSTAMLQFVRHALTLTERANGQLALLVRLQWMAGRRAAAVISSGPLSQAIVLTRRILWFDNGPKTTNGQHHHAWLFWDCSHGRLMPPSMIYAE